MLRQDREGTAVLADPLLFGLEGKVVVIQMLSHGFKQYAIVPRVKQMIVHHSSVDVHLCEELGSNSASCDPKPIEEEVNGRSWWSQDHFHSLPSSCLK